MLDIYSMDDTGHIVPREGSGAIVPTDDDDATIHALLADMPDDTAEDKTLTWMENLDPYEVGTEASKMRRQSTSSALKSAPKYSPSRGAYSPASSIGTELSADEKQLLKANLKAAIFLAREAGMTPEDYTR
mmetsp:Transcript_14735/g.42436  ORF Transcript_14735/g.42436 Transcript_14735/m.42436 type:complete len:131 (-) Transcript_14735:7-399(-)